MVDKPMSFIGDFARHRFEASAFERLKKADKTTATDRPAPLRRFFH